MRLSTLAALRRDREHVPNVPLVHFHVQDVHVHVPVHLKFTFSLMFIFFANSQAGRR
jgi:hypothetical protein